MRPVGAWNFVLGRIEATGSDDTSVIGRAFLGRLNVSKRIRGRERHM